MYRVEDRVPEPLYVLAVYSNPFRFKSREKLYGRFAKHMVDSGATLYTVESALGDREFSIDHLAPDHVPANAVPIAETLPPFGAETCRHDDPRRGQHRYIRLRADVNRVRGRVIWTKENMINVGLTFLPKDAKYVAWIDADWEFSDPAWVQRTLAALQHYDFVQMFSHYHDLGPNYEVIGGQPKMGFVACWQAGFPPPPAGPSYYAASGQQVRGKIAAWSPGGAWAARLSSIDDCDGLMDFNVVGGGDNHMAFSLVGGVQRFFYPAMTKGYRDMLLAWQTNAVAKVRKNIGCLPGHALHHFHGPKSQRGYRDRWRVLRDCKYDPTRDIQYDRQGLLYLVDHGTERDIRLRDGIRATLGSRNEDSLETD